MGESNGLVLSGLGMDPRTVSRRYVMAGTGLLVPGNLVC